MLADSEGRLFPSGRLAGPITTAARAATTIARSLLHAARASDQRRLLVLEGERDLALRIAAGIASGLPALAATHPPAGPLTGSATGSIAGANEGHAAPSPVVTWIGTECPGRDAASGRIINHLAPAQATSLLGGDCDLLIYDAWSGLDADALGAAVGTLRGGGLWLLLTPLLADWAAWPDPEAVRLAVHQTDSTAVGRRYIARFARLLAAVPLAVRCPLAAAPASAAAGLIAAAAARPAIRRDQPTRADGAVSAEQAAAIAAILALAQGRGPRLLVLTAARGRGKSAALGIAAARLLRPAPATAPDATTPQTILVTAPRWRAAAMLFERTAAHGIGPADGLRFVAPDALAAALADQADDPTNSARPNLLLIDEAAGIPAPLLERLVRAQLQGGGRLVMSTTVHGYEGTGRGFAVRFLARLDRLAPGWRMLRLETPVRWASDDPLETLLGQLLLLDAAPAATPGDPAAARLYWLDRDRLATDEPLLRQVFGLLMLGHYQTRPTDLRHLLDGPNLALAILASGGTVLATALVAREGRLAPALLEPIFAGQRRPRGHLLPQTLSAHAGLVTAPGLGYLRVVRIAVHPGARRHGLGRRLLAGLATRAGAEGLDLLGASFGARAGLIAFWRRCGLEPVHLGTRPNAASGAHAVVVLGALSPVGSALLARARARLPAALATLLPGPLRHLDPALVLALLEAMPATTPAPGLTERDELAAFAHAARPLEAALPVLRWLALTALPGALQRAAIDPPLAAALVVALLQLHPPADGAARLGLSGRAALVQQLRQGIAALLSGADH